jgi:uncharacterized protein YggE
MALVSALSMLALFLLVLTINATFNLSRFGMPYANTITVEAVGEATAVPNIASISFSIQEKADTVEAAQTAATEKTNAALAFLKDSGIEEKDIKTVAYNVTPTYKYQQPCYSGVCPDYREPEITGYEVWQTVEVKVRDTKKTGEVLQGLGNLSVGNIYGPNFTVDDDEAVKASAREDAIKKAKEKARLLAKDLGVNLGRVVSFYENSGYYPMYDSMAYGKGGDMMEVAAPAPELPVGETETTVSISITYEIW